MSLKLPDFFFNNKDLFGKYAIYMNWTLVSLSHNAVVNCVSVKLSRGLNGFCNYNVFVEISQQTFRSEIAQYNVYLFFFYTCYMSYTKEIEFRCVTSSIILGLLWTNYDLIYKNLPCLKKLKGKYYFELIFTEYKHVLFLWNNEQILILI